MFGFDEINVGLSFPFFLFFIFLVLLLAYSVFVYRFTLPPVSKGRKILLVSLRSLSLFLLLLIFFEPILTLSKTIYPESLNLVFIDKSISIENEEGDKKTLNFTESILSSGVVSEREIKSFGDDVNDLIVIADSMRFDSPVTNISQVFNYVKDQEAEVKSITIISDGIITEGINPVYTAKQLNMPVLTIGVGDTTKRKDIRVDNILYNDLLYVKTETKIVANISNTGLSGENVTVSLYESNRLVDQKNVLLNDALTNVEFNYTPETPGEKKLRVSVTELSGETTKENNRKIFYADVLSDKINLTIVSSSPSSDLAFIKNSLRNDENLSIKTITEIGNGKYLEEDVLKNIDSTDIFLLLGFPSKSSSNQLVERVVKLISDSKISFLIQINAETDLNKLSGLNSVIPVTVNGLSNRYFRTQVSLEAATGSNSIIFDPVEENKIWSSFPPVLYPNGNINEKPGAKVLITTKPVNTQPINPVFVTNQIAGLRSASFIGKEFWRWKLQSSESNSSIFDKFFFNLVRWLNSAKQDKQFSVRTSKKVYSPGEQIELNARLLDESLNPVSNAIVTVELNLENETENLQLNSVGGGLYEGKVKILSPGDYSFNAKAYIDNNLVNQTSGSFNVGEIEIELVNTEMDLNLLTNLAEETGGKFFWANETDDYTQFINQINLKDTEGKIVTSEFRLWSSEAILILVILFFSLEWFFRKRFGMI